MSTHRTNGVYQESRSKGAARESRMLAVNGLAKVTQRLDKVVRSDAQGKLTMWSQARSFYGRDDPLEEFLPG